MKGVQGPVLADVAANVLVMTLVVLIAVGRFSMQDTPAPPAHALTLQPVVPLGGAEAVELLRQRLLPAATGLADIGQGSADLPASVTTLFILDPVPYAASQARLLARDQDWQELTVPQALIGADGSWHPDFLALASIAEDPDRFRTGLAELLARRAGNGGATGAAMAEGGGIALRFAGWFRAALDVLALSGLCLAFWALLRLRRWALRV